jgi:hypothetical protein
MLAGTTWHRQLMLESAILARWFAAGPSRVQHVCVAAFQLEGSGGDMQDLAAALLELLSATTVSR